MLGDDTSERQDLSSTDLERRTRFLALGLFGFKNGGLQKSLKGKTVTFAMEGSRNFRPPAVLGETRYEGCAIVVFDPTIALGRDSFMNNAGNSAARFEDIAGTRIAIFEEPQENDVWTTFVGFPRSNIVLVASNADYLRNVLARIGGAPPVRGPCRKLWRNGSTSTLRRQCGDCGTIAGWMWIWIRRPRTEDAVLRAYRMTRP